MGLPKFMLRRSALRGAALGHANLLRLFRRMWDDARPGSEDDRTRSVVDRATLLPDEFYRHEQPFDGVDWRGARRRMREAGPVREIRPAKVKPGQEKLGTPEQIGAANQERIRAIVTRDNWKFCQNGLGVHELYDMSADPLERRNLARDAAQKDRVADLRQRIAAWQKRVGDPG